VLAVTVVVLGLLTVLMKRIGGTILFPPALFSAAWFGTLAGVLMGGQQFLPIRESVCLLYIVGALAFAVGGIICAYCINAGRAYERSLASARITRSAMDVLLITLVASYPYYLRIAVRIAGTSSPILFLPAIRSKMLASGGNPFGLAGNLNVLASLVCVAVVYESDGSLGGRFRAVMSTLLALAYSALTGSKLGVLLVVTLFFVTQVRAGRIRIMTALITCTAALTLFVGGLLAINLAGQGFGDTGATLAKVGDDIANYWLGSPVAFSQIAMRPDSLPSAENINRFFLETARSLGGHVRVPRLNTKYTVFSSSGEDSNTYTIYFSYFKDYGWFGAVILLGALGAFLTLIWRRAMSGQPVAIIFYASFCTAIVQSIYSEGFFLGLNQDIKALVLYGALYWVLPRYLSKEGREDTMSFPVGDYVD
jgi:oligosaccharide repeat unit polymerase